MCGIAGYLNLDPRRPADPMVVARMLSALTHRGPDEEGLAADGPVALGCRRLRLVDPAGGRQPFFSEDGAILLVGNGEVFNHVEIRDRLAHRGHAFRSASDLEVIVHLYEEAGADFVAELDGQFAVALYDRRAGRLVLTRDRFGICPLVHASAGGAVIFASEIKGVLRHGAVAPAVDLLGLDQVMTLPGLVSPRTMFEGISSLGPGEQLIAAAGSCTVRRYWDIDYPTADDPAPSETEEEAVDRLKGCLAESVRRQMAADVEVGCYLSGGLDSALIAALARAAAPDVPLPSFSLAVEGRGLSERPYQRLVARELGTRHTEVHFGEADLAASIRRMVHHAECPVRESYNTCALILAEQVRARGVRAVLGGQGADELFAGYPGYRFDAAGCHTARRGLAAEATEGECQARMFGDPLIRYERRYHEFGQDLAALYSPEVNRRLAEARRDLPPLVDARQIRGRHPLHQRSYLDLKLRLADHLLGDHGDRMALAHGVEGRYPFLGRDVVECARRLAPDMKVRGNQEKYILRRVARGLVPDPVIRREKFGFRSYTSAALLGRGLDWVEHLLDEATLRRQGFFDPAAVARLRTRDASRPLHPLLDDDFLLIVLTFGLLLEDFVLPCVSA